MIRNRLIQILLLPISLLYGLTISIRNGLYGAGLLRPVKFNIPVIGVGNLSIGGAGKTPHIEYLVELLRAYMRLAILSRGYKRKTKGFRIAAREDTSITLGDEPLQYHLKYRDVVTAVSESRSIGIPNILSRYPEIQAVLLDDSYQHRSVEPGLNILLTEFAKPYYKDFLMPSGRLREWESAASRADVIIVTKCPNEVSTTTQVEIREKLDVLPHQTLFFSKYEYGIPYSLLSGERRSLNSFEEIILLTAIANIDYLLSYIDSATPEIHSMAYEDHHYFSPHDMSIINQQYQQLESTSKAILTTEKDATRLILHRDFLRKENIAVYVLPIRVKFLDNQAQDFDNRVKTFLLNFKV